jgi:hypothetical protein
MPWLCGQMHATWLKDTDHAAGQEKIALQQYQHHYADLPSKCQWLQDQHTFTRYIFTFKEQKIKSGRRNSVVLLQKCVLKGSYHYDTGISGHAIDTKVHAVAALQTTHRHVGFF